MYNVKSIETANNIYEFGYNVIAKTTYEQREEHKQRFKYILIQKLIGAMFITACISFSLISKEGSGALLSLIGLYPLLSKELVFIL